MPSLKISSDFSIVNNSPNLIPHPLDGLVFSWIKTNFKLWIQNFDTELVRILKANPLNVFGAFATTMTSQRMSFRLVLLYHVLLFGRNLKGEF